VLAVVVCALVLTVAVPLRTYVAQRQELAETLARQDAARAEVAELTQRRTQLQDPAYVEAQARERLRFVKPGDTPYQVQLPDSVEKATSPTATPDTRRDPWYSELWGTLSAPAP
jgi:cell division protein FtsB